MDPEITVSVSAVDYRPVGPYPAKETAGPGAQNGSGQA